MLLLTPLFWAADGGLCAAPITAQCDANGVASAAHDPHLKFAEGGVADFRGKNGTFYALLSAPGVHFAAMTVNTAFLLPNGPVLVEGSFFSEVAWVLRGASGTAYGVRAVADVLGFDVFKLGPALLLPWAVPKLVAIKRDVWQEWKEDRLRVYLKQSTIFVRANGWEVNCTRNPIYLHVAGSSRWRFDIAVRMLDGSTGFEALHGKVSEACVAHGVIGQSFDGDGVAVDGHTDSYVPTDPFHPVIQTRAQAEGAIEGAAEDYALRGPWDAAFKFGRFSATDAEACTGRNVSLLKGKKTVRARGSRVALTA